MSATWFPALRLRLTVGSAFHFCGIGQYDGVMTMTIEPPGFTFGGNAGREHDAAWRAEFRRRIDAIESGHIQMLDADEMDAELLAELAEMDRS